MSHEMMNTGNENDLRSVSRLALAGIPWDENSSFMRGASEAPSLIRATFFSEASGLRSEGGIEFHASDFFDAGDVPLRSGVAMLNEIEGFIGKLLDQNLHPISLGGDHTVSYPILKAFARKYNDLTVLLFDAHSDLYDIYQDNRYSHACPFARVMEEGLVKRLVEVGIRTLNRSQREQAKRFGVEIVEMKDWPGRLDLILKGPVYLSVDLDAFDPAFAPGVAHPEPGGFTPRQVIDTLLTLDANLVGADIVEFNPRRDVAQLTEHLSAKLVKEIAAAMHRVQVM